jgi:hypothetical protein
MGVVMVMMMVPVMRRRKTRAREQAKRNCNSDELGHDYDPICVN